jgi:hypothetical protein
LYTNLSRHTKFFGQNFSYIAKVNKAETKEHLF